MKKAILQGRSKPATLDVHPDSIPPELKAVANWVIWRWQWDEGGKWTKPPYQIQHPDRYASHSNPDTWGPFGGAWSRVGQGKADGLGFVFGKDAFCGVDLDDCRHPETGVIDQWAREILDSLNSYTDVSPTGTGVKVFTRAKLPGPGRKKPELEIYDRNRFFTVTGQRLTEYPASVEGRQDETVKLYQEWFPETVKERQPKAEQPRPESADWPDAEIVSRAREAANGDKFARLWEGDWTGYATQSQADFALMAMLAFWTGPDEERLAELFTASALFRPHPDKSKGYPLRTARKAIADREGYYGFALPADTDERLADLFQAKAEANGQAGPPKDQPPPDAALVSDPRFAYLWHGQHRRLNDSQRARRIASVNDVAALMPSRGFFADYLASRLPTTDAPAVFHLGAALAMAAHAVNRRAWVVTGDDLLHPNLWIGLIAGSTTFHKTVSINPVRKFLAEDTRWEDTLLPQSFTMEALMMRLGTLIQPGESLAAYRNAARDAFAKDPNYLKGVGLFHVDEIGGWLATLSQTYNLGGEALLTEWFNNPADWNKATKGQGTYYVYRPCISILGASTIDWLTARATESMKRGGFLPRWLFFTANEKDYILALRDRPNPEATDRVRTGLEALKARQGEYTLAADAEDHYVDWRVDLEANAAGEIKSWVGRMGEAALKIALLYQATMGDSRVIGHTALTLATRLITRLRDDLVRLLRWELSFSREETERKKVERLIHEAGPDGIPHSTLLKALSPMSADTLRKILQTLTEAGTIRVESTQAANRRPANRYFWSGHA